MNVIFSSPYDPNNIFGSKLTVIMQEQIDQEAQTLSKKENSKK
ncbi:hypothetical protein pb186bvf_002254 [Paramecium bursaria]